MALPMRIATVTLGTTLEYRTLTAEQRAAAEHTMALWFGVAKKLSQAQCDAFNRECRRTEGAGKFAPIYPGWFTFFVNAKGELVDGCGEYGNRDAAIWEFHCLMTTEPRTDADWEEHRRSLGYRPSRVAA